MLKSIRSKKSEKGFTLIELLVVAAIIGILLAIAIPNLIKARMSANEANGRKAMQTMRDAEGEFFEQDLNSNGTRDYTDLVGDNATANSLRYPDGNVAFDETDALVDNSFEDAYAGAAAAAATCTADKAGYCVTDDMAGSLAVQNSATPAGWDGYGWEASMTSYNKTGRRDFSTYDDGVIRCVLDGQAEDGTGTPATPGTIGQFSAGRGSPGCD